MNSKKIDSALRDCWTEVNGINLNYKVFFTFHRLKSTFNSTVLWLNHFDALNWIWNNSSTDVVLLDRESWFSLWHFSCHPQRNCVILLWRYCAYENTTCRFHHVGIIALVCDSFTIFFVAASMKSTKAKFISRNVAAKVSVFFLHLNKAREYCVSFDFVGFKRDGWFQWNWLRCNL